MNVNASLNFLHNCFEFLTTLSFFMYKLLFRQDEISGVAELLNLAIHTRIQQREISNTQTLLEKQP